MNETRVVVFKYRLYWWAAAIPAYVKVYTELTENMQQMGVWSIMPFARFESIDKIPAYRGWSKRKALAHATALVLQGHGDCIKELTNERY